MNETIQTLKTRRSIRAFNDKPVPAELIEQIIDAGLWAPSGIGKQAPSSSPSPIPSCAIAFRR